ncbi:MAG: radical SAM protein [Polyangiales bacterium]
MRLQTLSIAERIAPRTVAGELGVREPRVPNGLRCTACAHRCVLEDGRTGACGVRTNVGGELRVPFGYVARKYVRAVETNTVHHVKPGAQALTFGMYGCDLRCPYCHNARVSQALRDGGLGDPGDPIEASPESLVAEARAAGCEVICSAYNEPMITAEWARAIFGEAKKHGMTTALITDGHTTPEALSFMQPVTDVFRVDLKGWSAEQYRGLGGRIEPVLASIADARRLGMWVEVVTLVVPGLNDDLAGLDEIARLLAAIDPSIPWHLDAFQPRYRMKDRPAPSPTFLAMAAGAAYARGLRFVYVGNVGDAFPDLSSTRCPRCTTTVVERRDWSCTRNALANGACPECGERVPGIF